MVEFNEFMKDGWSYPKNNCGGSVDPEVVEQSVNKYFEKNPPTSTSVESAINNYMEKNTPDDLSEGLTGALSEFIENNSTDSIDYLILKDSADENKKYKLSITNGTISIEEVI